MGWEREHDIAIAEHWQGYRVMWDGRAWRTTLDRTSYGPGISFIDAAYLAHYDRNVQAAIWAAEGWRKQDLSKNTWFLRAGESGIMCCVDTVVSDAQGLKDESLVNVFGEWKKRCCHQSASPSESLAWSLYKAVTR